LGGQVGTACFFQHKKTPELDDELEPFGAGDGIPPDEFVAALEVPCGGTPNQNSHYVAVLEDKLTEPVAGLFSRSEGMLVVEHEVGNFPVRRALGEAKLKWLVRGGGADWCGGFF